MISYIFFSHFIFISLPIVLKKTFNVSLSLKRVSLQKEFLSKESFFLRKLMNNFPTPRRRQLHERTLFPSKGCRGKKGGRAGREGGLRRLRRLRRRRRRRQRRQRLVGGRHWRRCGGGGGRSTRPSPPPPPLKCPRNGCSQKIIARKSICFRSLKKNYSEVSFFFLLFFCVSFIRKVFCQKIPQFWKKHT